MARTRPHGEDQQVLRPRPRARGRDADGERERDRRAARRQRRRQVDADQDSRPASSMRRAATSSSADRRSSIRSTTDAIAHGIETIYQDSALVTQLSIARNLFLGREPVRGPRFLNRMDQAAMNAVADELLKQVGITKDIPPTTPISSLSGGERQAVAIARAMHFDSDLIILDEPTNNLGVAETQGVLRFVRNAREFRTFLHLHRPQHPPRLPGGRPHRGAAPRPRRGRQHRPEADEHRGGRAGDHRHGGI